MIDKEFVPYELALELKQLGFDEPCFKYIYTGDTGNNVNIPCEVTPSSAKNYNEDDLSVSTPTFSQAFRWFRENYNIPSKIESTFEHETPKQYHYFYQVVTDDYVGGDGVMFNWTYEEAELACLKALIEIHKGGNK